MDKPYDWITTPTGDRCIVLEGNALVDWSAGPPEGYDCFLVTMTKALARTLLARMDTVTRLRATDPDVSSVEWFAYEGEWWPRDYERDDSTSETILPLWEGRTDFDSRTEVDRLVVEHDRVCWTAITKHSDVRLETAVLDRATVEQILAESEELSEDGRIVLIAATQAGVVVACRKCGARFNYSWSETDRADYLTPESFAEYCLANAADNTAPGGEDEHVC